MQSTFKKTIPILLFIIINITQNLYAQNITAINKGVITIIRPDNAIIHIGKGDTVPKIMPGSVIELNDGNVNVSVSDGSIKLAAADSVAMIKSVTVIEAVIYPDIRMVGFNVISGNTDIITGNLKTSLLEGQEIMLGFDKFSGVIDIQSVRGDIISFIAGARVMLLPNSRAQISLNPLSQNINIKSIAGVINVLSVYGEKYTINQNESAGIRGVFNKPSFAEAELPKTVAEAALEGKITVEEAAGNTAAGNIAEPTTAAGAEDDPFYFVVLPAEEPSEPEIPEASPYLP